MAEVFSNMGFEEVKGFHQVKMGMNKEQSKQQQEKNMACMENAVQLGWTVQYKQIIDHRTLK